MSDEKFQETLSVSVHEDVRSADKMGGDRPSDNVARTKELAMKYLARYVAPHNKPSREVMPEDIDRVLSEGEVMYNLCIIPRGGAANGAEAVAHMQIENDDPLAFFVTRRGEFVVNPKIGRTTNYYVDKDEGCMSFPAEPTKRVQRFHKVDVTFQTLVNGPEGKPVLSDAKTVGLSGHGAQVFQHECAHINGWNIYDADHVPEACMTKRTFDIKDNSA